MHSHSHSSYLAALKYTQLTHELCRSCGRPHAHTGSLAHLARLNSHPRPVSLALSLPRVPSTTTNNSTSSTLRRSCVNLARKDTRRLCLRLAGLDIPATTGDFRELRLGRLFGVAAGLGTQCHALVLAFLGACVGTSHALSCQCPP